MGTERSAQSYDEGYASNPRYKVDADHAPWSQLWYWVLGKTGEELVVDLGCGPGHLAELLKRRNHPAHLYLGIDFSKVALEQARARAPGYRFVQGTLPGAIKTHVEKLHRPTAVFTEVLEHFTQDLEALKLLRPNTRVLATVPMRDSSGHVRHFRNMASVCERYAKVLNFRSVERIESAYAFEGFIR